MSNKIRGYLLVLICVSFLCTLGCAGQRAEDKIKADKTKPETTARTLDNKDNASQMRSAELPNPAARKCKDDGYEVVQKLENGVPITLFCVDKKTGKTCEVWAYYRGECFMDKKD